MSKAQDEADRENWHWHKRAQDILDSHFSISEWEENFLTSIRRQRKHLTEKQRAIIARLCEELNV
jgi:hypothetical protein